MKKLVEFKNCLNEREIEIFEILENEYELLNNKKFDNLNEVDEVLENLLINENELMNLNEILINEMNIKIDEKDILNISSICYDLLNM